MGVVVGLSDMNKHGISIGCQRGKTLSCRGVGDGSQISLPILGNTVNFGDAHSNSLPLQLMSSTVKDVAPLKGFPSGEAGWPKARLMRSPDVPPRAVVAIKARKPSSKDLIRHGCAVPPSPKGKAVLETVPLKII